MAELRHTLEALIQPVFVVLMLVVLALYFCWEIRASRWLLSLVGLILLSMSTAFIPQCLTHYLESIYPPVSKYDESISTIVVLSGGQADLPNHPANEVLNSASIKRLLAGIRLLQNAPNATLILSGGGYGHQVAESSYMSDLAKMCGVNSQSIQIEDQSINTEDQANILKQTLGNTPFYLVTSAVHMPRSMALFEDNGMHPVAAPTDFTHYWQDERWQKRLIPNAHNLVYTEIALHEWLGLLYRSISKRA